MENKVIEKVLNAELQTEKMIEEAKLQATKILQKAESNAENLKAKSIEENKNLVKENRQAVEESKNQEYLENIKAYQEECEEISKNFANFDKAIDLIIKRIV